MSFFAKQWQNSQAVAASYDAIAPSFAASRKGFWPEFSLFKQYSKSGDKIIDLGCGSGRLFDFLQQEGLKVDYWGLDISSELLNVAKTNHPDLAGKFILGSLPSLPFPDNSCDVIACFAAFHHLPNRNSRLQALQEMKRILKSGGIIVMTNWYLWIYKFLPNFLRAIFTFTFFKDLLIVWKGEKDKLIWRYYHAFTINELNKLFIQAGFKPETTIFTNKKGSKRNLLSIAKKVNKIHE